MGIYQQIQDTRTDLKLTLELAKEYGLKWAAAKAKYETVKAKRTLDFKADGYAATIIDKIIKGDPEVNDALYLMDSTEVEYKNAVEAINVLKKDYDYLREQYQREWTQAGWSDR